MRHLATSLTIAPCGAGGHGIMWDGVANKEVMPELDGALCAFQNATHLRKAQMPA